VPLNNTAIHLALDALDETATSGVKFVGIHTLTDPGTGATANAGEATGGSPAYARIAATWGAAASLVKSNTNTFTFDVPAGTYGFFTLWNTSTLNSGTQYLGYIPFGGANAIKGFYSVDTTLTNDQLLSPGHGMSNGDRVMLFNVFGDALSTGLTEGTIYFVVNAATDTFKVSTTSGGAAVDITAVGGGEGYFQRVIPETFGAQGQITVAAAALVLDGSVL
jgi:hypothetical protein